MDNTRILFKRLILIFKYVLYLSKTTLLYLTLDLWLMFEFFIYYYLIFIEPRGGIIPEGTVLVANELRGYNAIFLCILLTLIYSMMHGSVNMLIWTFLTRSQCRVIDTQLTVKIHKSLVNFYPKSFIDFISQEWRFLKLCLCELQIILTGFFFQSTVCSLHQLLRRTKISNWW